MTDERRITERLARSLAERAPSVLVVGDAILDVWLSGDCHRLAREAPAPVLDIADERCAPGGAANTAVNLAALGARVRMVATVGDDREGELLLAALRAAGVDVSGVLAVPDRVTTTKRRLMADGQLLARVDESDGRPPPADLLRELGAEPGTADALVVCDYGLGLCTGEVRDQVARVRAACPLFVVDAHDVTAWAALRPDLVTPNADEVATALGAAPPAEARARVAWVCDRAPALRAATGAATVVVTLDRDGSVLLADDLPVHRTWTDPVPDRQATGAGDTFVAALCVARAAGLPLTTAVELAQAAADVVVHEPGTAVCTTESLARRLSRFRSAAQSADTVARQVATHRTGGARIVFTNGCFDLLHAGHVAYLNQAKALGDVLVVGVNSDSGVRRLKGPGRPVNAAEDRAAVVAALSCVDHVVVFDGEDAVGLVDLLRPDVYAKGGDYTPEMLPETAAVRRYGGEVRILDYLPDRSGTAVIERIRAASGTR